MSPGVQSIADLTTEIRPTTGDIPPPLVGASTIVSGNHLYVFGGRLVSSRQMTNCLFILDLTTYEWRQHVTPPESPSPPPQPRYFHTASVHKNYMVIFGGMSYSPNSQDLCALDDVCMLDLTTLDWVYPVTAPSIFKPQPRYAHLAVAVQDKLVVMGGQDMANQYIKEINVMDLNSFTWIQACNLEGQYGAYRSVICSPSPSDPTLAAGALLNQDTMEGSTLTDKDLPICVYSNYNFAEVVRDLQMFHPLRSAQHTGHRNHSNEMSGAAMPPGLRFPMGHLLGHHMILTGTYLTPSHRAFHVWALNLANLVWTRIDTGSIFTSGSWSRSVLGEDQQKFYILGHRDRDLLEDYNRRQVNFDHIACVDMEAFGIYAYPQPTCAPVAQELGLSMLNEPSIADVEIVTADRKSIPANSAILSDRWPQFAQMVIEDNSKRKHATSSEYKILSFPENYAVTLAFLQFIYTDHLITANQAQPHILSRLLLLADMYNMPRLVQLATHALHQILTISTASMIYETAALTNRTALQVRALRVMINAKKLLQQQQSMIAAAGATVDVPDPSMPVVRRSHEDIFVRRIPSHDSDESIPSPLLTAQSSTTLVGSSSTLRRLATSKSSTTAAAASDSYHSFSSPIPKMSKSGTIMSTSGNTHHHHHPPTVYFERPRKSSLASIHQQQQPLPGKPSPPLDRPIRF